VIGEDGGLCGPLNYSTPIALDAAGGIPVMNSLNLSVPILGWDSAYLFQFGGNAASINDRMKPRRSAVDSEGLTGCPIPIVSFHQIKLDSGRGNVV
jgi:hypothetical protein